MARKSSKTNGDAGASSKKATGAGASSKVETNTPVEVKKGENVVLVYCMLPSGMSFPTPFGLVTLNGSNVAQLVGGYGKTHVPKKAWEYVKSVYKSMKVFDENNPVIFEAESAEDGDEAAQDQGESVSTGLEQKAPNEIVKKAEAQAGNKQPKEED